MYWRLIERSGNGIEETDRRDATMVEMLCRRDAKGIFGEVGFDGVVK